LSLLVAWLLVGLNRAHFKVITIDNVLDGSTLKFFLATTITKL